MKIHSVFRGASALALGLSASLTFATADAREARTGEQQRDIRHVLLISVDGLHELDVQNWTKTHPGSTLASLSKTGVSFTNAKAPTPSDSFPGLLALVTGGTPKSTGVYYDDSYDRTLFSPGNFNCAGNAGTEIIYTEQLDHDMNQLFSGGIDPVNLPLQKTSTGCSPVFPHQFIRVNTIFEVAKAAGLQTAWSDKHPAYDLVNGPSGKGVDDLYTPEINSLVRNGGVANGVDLTGTLAQCNTTNSLSAQIALTDMVYTDCGPSVEAYDDVKVQAIINEIHGKRSDGSAGQGVPNIFGMNFQAVSVSEKLPMGGYKDASGTPSNLLADAIGHSDRSLGRMVEALEQQKLLDSTLIIVSAKHGQSPIDKSKLQMEAKATQAPDRSVKDPQPFINQVDPNVDNVVFDFPGETNGDTTYAINGHLQTDDVGLLWLQNQSKSNIDGVVAELQANRAAIHATTLPANTIFETNITSGPDLAKIFGNPLVPMSLAAARAPNVFIQPNEGVIYSNSKKKIAEHGGGAPGDVDVALIVSNPGLRPATVDEIVHTTQVAPTILKALGLNAQRLDAVRKEGADALPLDLENEGD